MLSITQRKSWLHFGTEVQGDNWERLIQCSPSLGKYLWRSLCLPESCLGRRKVDSSRTPPCCLLRMGFPPGSSLIHQVESITGHTKKTRLFSFCILSTRMETFQQCGILWMNKNFLKNLLMGFYNKPLKLPGSSSPFLAGFCPTQHCSVLFQNFFFSVWWEDESADCRTHSFGKKMFSLDIDMLIFLYVLVHSIHILGKSY